MDNAQNEIPLPQRMGNLESMLHSVVNTLDALKPLFGSLPVVGTALTTADAVGHVVERVVDLAQGDAAGLAASNISASTGDTALDARLMQIETFILAAAPLLKVIAHHFGYDAPAAYVVAAPMENPEIG